MNITSPSMSSRRQIRSMCWEWFAKVQYVADNEKHVTAANMKMEKAIKSAPVILEYLWQSTGSESLRPRFLHPGSCFPAVAVQMPHQEEFNSISLCLSLVTTGYLRPWVLDHVIPSPDSQANLSNINIDNQESKISSRESRSRDEYVVGRSWVTEWTWADLIL
jgi:hypothetical protein